MLCPHLLLHGPVYHAHCCYAHSETHPLTHSFLLPAQVFEINPIKAWSAVAITLTSVAASLYLISVSPWYLLPFAWFIAGTAFTGVSGSSAVCVGCAMCFVAP